MTRQREIPSVLYRHQNQINMTFPVLPGVQKIRVSGAARLNDAYGNFAGVGGGGVLPMFEVLSGATYKSPSLMARKLPSLEDINREATRMVFDPDDFATPAQAPGTSYLPTDDQTIFIRISTWNPVASAWNPPGPIMAIPPYDFMTTKQPTFTVSGIAPNLNIGAFPPNIPDFLPPTVLNFLLPAYGETVSVEDLEAVGGLPIFVSYHPGVPPMVVRPDHEVCLTGAGVPEFFIACPNGNPWFTIRLAITNSA